MNWYHAHVYFNADDAGIAAARALLEKLGQDRAYEYVGDLELRAVGPHPLPQFEAHFTEDKLWQILPNLHRERGRLSVLVHPVTPNDHEDHFDDAIWLGEPRLLDPTKLDPPGMNKAFFRLGKVSKS